MSHSVNYPEISNRILSLVPAEKIFVLTPIETDHCFLLVLVSKERNCLYADIQNKIESVCKTICPVTALAMEMEMFNEWLGEGHPFAVQTKTKAWLVYDAERITLADHQPVNVNGVFIFRKNRYAYGMKRMQQLMHINKFHEASVEGLRSITEATSGLVLQSNNIDRLIDYCAIAVKEMPKIFPDEGYDVNPPAEKIEALLKALYAPYQILKHTKSSIS